jgi:hypothetical protein
MMFSCVYTVDLCVCLCVILASSHGLRAAASTETSGMASRGSVVGVLLLT